MLPTHGGGSPNYSGLLKFLLGPFLDNPESLRIDCELLNNRSRVWIRVAFEGEDKGKAYGRGGRNIQAIRAVLEASARSVGQSIHLDVFGGDYKTPLSEQPTPSKSPRNSPPKRLPNKINRKPQ